ncbi:MAG: creatininase family protein [Armatimonadota bacterium]
MDKSRIMFNMTVQEVRSGLEEMKTVIVPVGVVEQHGYHLPLSTDILIATEIARMTSERNGCFVAPCVHYNFSGGTLPGTINISPQAFSLVLMDICRSLILQGFRNIAFLLGHGGTESVQAVKDAALTVQRLEPSLSDVSVSVVPAGDMSPTCMAAFDEGDFHAARFETSLILYFKPELVKLDKAIYDTEEFAAKMRTDQDAFLCKHKAIDDKYVVPKLTQNPEMQVGVMGVIGEPSVEYGKQIAEECVQGLLSLIDRLERRLQNG